MSPGTVRLAEQAWAWMGWQGKKHRGHPSPEPNTVRGGSLRGARGQLPQVRAAGRSHTPRGEPSRLSCDFPQGGDASHRKAPPTSLAGGRGAVSVNRDELSKGEPGMQESRPAIKHWTNREEAQLRELWPLMGIKCRDHFPGRSDSAIFNRVCRLGLQARGWTAADDDVVRTHYRRGWHICATYLSSIRSRHAICARARRLGVAHGIGGAPAAPVRHVEKETADV